MNEGKCIAEKTLRSIQGKDRRGVHRNHHGMKGKDNGGKGAFTKYTRNTRGKNEHVALVKLHSAELLEKT